MVNDMTATAKKTTAKPAAKKVAKPEKPRATFADTAKITLIAKENPKREGTKAHTAFNLYKSGQTVREVLDAGQTRSNLIYDVRHGYIKIA